MLRTPSIWDEFMAPGRSSRAKLQAWRLLRQFASCSEFEAEFQSTPNWLWRTVEQSGSVADDAVKLLLANRRGVRCETVALFPSASPARATACVSSQPGCGVGCPFCATGELGYRGNLTAEEIVEQVYWVGTLARQTQRSLRNVVFMGMGEPLHNTHEVLRAIDGLISQELFGLSPRRITVSTAGVPQAMVELARQFPRVRLALSLHAAEPTLRRRLVPRAVADLELFRTTIAEVNRLQDSQPVWVEVVLFAGINDSEEHARKLIQFCSGLRVEVNLIPYNSAAGAREFAASSRERREAFAARLRDAGFRTTLRTSFGTARNAACGQLNAMAKPKSTP